MRHHAKILRPKFDAVQWRLEQDLGGRNMGNWSRPEGGYFVSFNAIPGTAAEIVRLAGEAGVKLTPAGSTFPYGIDSADFIGRTMIFATN